MRFMNRRRFRLRKRDAAIVIRDNGNGLGYELYIPRGESGDQAAPAAMETLLFAVLTSEKPRTEEIRHELWAIALSDQPEDDSTSWTQ